MRSAVPFVIAVLYGIGTYLLLQRTLTRIVLGIALMSHGANLLLLLAGGGGGAPPISDGDQSPLGTTNVLMSDPLPQAFVLTSIVIGLGIIAFVLVLAYRSWTLTASDEVEDDIEDRRIARSEPDLNFLADGVDQPLQLSDPGSQRSDKAPKEIV